MADRARERRDLAALVDNMFAEVLTPEERAGLLEWIRVWEEANPGATSAQRVTGWIDVAYAYQARGRHDSADSATRVTAGVIGLPGSV
jgi:hypothetical protein